ncbi:MAG: ExbD/TolR family protein [Polaromonas sp.]
MSFGRFDSTKPPRPLSDINVTPLVDVMLVLLVIFILTAPLLASSIKLELPKADATPSAQTPQFVTLVVNASGAVFLSDQPIALDALRTRLQQSAAQDPDTEVQLRADARVPYGRVVEVMGVAQKAGLTRIGFVAEPPH